MKTWGTYTENAGLGGLVMEDVVESKYPFCLALLA
jgi:hypothetical protein